MTSSRFHTVVSRSTGGTGEELSTTSRSLICDDILVGRTFTMLTRLTSPQPMRLVRTRQSV
ncbi:hypothetical protein MXD61_20855 [Frankia sp. AgPm24]|uniref:hypothetical protein n=1 Tax=Frankia sp. AgPm24 TaxID=631128 RepID=UPI00200D674F|nr:hypothetical protein [Frankia sp. AgPm24]MCK9924287.1 hypothetical protein [Frankia sp. AgPm24]